MENKHPLYQQELELEKEMTERGVSRMRRIVSVNRAKGQEAHNPYGSVLIKRGIAPLVDAIRAFIAKAYSGKAGRKHIAAVYLRDMDAEVVAYITLRKLIDVVSLKPERLFSTAAREVGREIEMEANLGVLKREDVGTYRRMQISMHRTTRTRRNRRIIQRFYFSKSMTVDYDAMPESDALHIGAALTELCCTATGLFSRYTYTKKSKRGGALNTTHILRTTPDCLEFIEQHVESQSLLNPDFMPTIIPPRRWGKRGNGGAGAVGGGYHNHALPRLNFVKTRDREYLKALDAKMEAGELDTVTQAVNALQETAWRVNARVLETITTLWDAGGDMAGLPLREDAPLPRCPVCGADVTENVTSGQADHPCITMLRDTDFEAYRNWQLDCKAVHTRNTSNFGRRLGVARNLALARKYQQYERFYYPYQLDFRGRIYAVPPFFNPQGAPVAKGLLEFADGKPLGSMMAVKWLAVHGANCFGNDKVSLDERYSWVVQHQNHILAAADNPLENRWWMDADEPACFLAFCFEWAGYVQEGLDYVSHIPVAMDGSCNGLQIFSLLLRDAEGGRAVNLTPTQQPHDIYQIVADKVKAQLEATAAGEGEDVYATNAEGDEYLRYNTAEVAHAFLRLGIDRKTTKRQVMVLPYGGTVKACTEYTREWIDEKLAAHKGDAPLWPEHISLWNSTPYLSNIIWQEMVATVIAARDAMSFLRKLATIVAKKVGPIRWTTPCGFPVLQQYWDVTPRRIKTNMGETVIQYNMIEHTDTIDVAAQRTGFSPNFVHSLDAAALMQTVTTAQHKGVEAFAMIHDSYGTHAADTETLASVLRTVFVEMFSGNLLERLLFEVKASLPLTLHERLPAVPTQGNLSVEDVKNAKFFFS